MSLATQVSQAINAAKAGLGDLVVPATLKSMGARVYVNGSYVYNHTNIPIEGVLDKFDYMETQSPEFNQNDLKFNVFNPTNTLNISTDDKITLHNVTYAVNKVTKVYVGVMVPMITVYLRK